MKKTLLTPLFVILCAGSLAACSSSNSDGSAGSGPQEPRSGTVSVTATGEPVDDATEVIVAFTGVEIKPQSGESLHFDLESPRSINLLDLQGNSSEVILEDVSLPAGEYAFVLLKVDAEAGVMDSYITLSDGTQSPLVIAGADPQGLRLVSGFTVDHEGEAAFTVDFDLRAAIVRPSGQNGEFQLRPALRMVDHTEVGHLVGDVDALIATEGLCFDAATATTLAAVYLFEASATQPGDVCVADEAEACPQDVDRPLGAVGVTAHPDDATRFSYTFGFLSAGDYRAALTCQSSLDDPMTDDRAEVSFEMLTDFSITADAETRLDFNIAADPVEQPDDETPDDLMINPEPVVEDAFIEG